MFLFSFKRSSIKTLLSCALLAFPFSVQDVRADTPLNLSDSTVQNQVYANKDLSNSAIQDLRFDNVSFNNTDFADSRFDNVTFNNCRFQFTNFAGAHFSNVTFISGDLRQARFNNASLKNVEFKSGVKMFGVDLSVAKRQNVDAMDVDYKTKIAVTSDDIAQKLSAIGGENSGDSSVDLYVQFKFNSDVIEADAIEQLDALAQALKSPNLASATILIAGHTDSVGAAAYNNDLSYRRAVAVRRALVDDYGVKFDRLRVKGYGETKPVQSNKTAYGRSVNRRVTIMKITK